MGQLFFICVPSGILRNCSRWDILLRNLAIKSRLSLENHSSFSSSVPTRIYLSVKSVLSGINCAPSTSELILYLYTNLYKLLIQNQSELIKQGILDRPYRGIASCFARTYKNEGFLSFWRGNTASVIRYIPMQAMNFAFKDQIKSLFPKPAKETNAKKLARNTVSGGLAGTISVTGIKILYKKVLYFR